MFMTMSDFEDLQSSDEPTYAYFDSYEVPLDSDDELIEVRVVEDPDSVDVFVSESSIDDSEKIEFHSSPILDDGDLAIPVEVKFVRAV